MRAWTRRSGLVAAVTALVIGAVALPGTTTPATAAEHRVAVTAHVASVQHALGRVVLEGTGAPGSNVFLGGDVLRPGVGRVAADGTWRAQVGVAKDEHRVEVVSDQDWSPITVPVTILIQNDLDWEALQHGSTVDLGANWHPGARIRLTVDGVLAATIAADPTGRWHHRITGLTPGVHAVEAAQRFDGAVNGRYAQTFIVPG